VGTSCLHALAVLLLTRLRRVAGSWTSCAQRGGRWRCSRSMRRTASAPTHARSALHVTLPVLMWHRPSNPMRAVLLTDPNDWRVPAHTSAGAPTGARLSTGVQEAVCSAPGTAGRAAHGAHCHRDRTGLPAAVLCAVSTNAAAFPLLTCHCAVTTSQSYSNHNLPMPSAKLLGALELLHL